MRLFLGHRWIYLIDNGSSKENLDKLKDWSNSFRMFHCDNIPRGPGPYDYPYCWRALYYIRNLIEIGYEKIIFIDTDGFILSKRLARYIGDRQSGWVSFWSNTEQFPEASIHVLSDDTFYLFNLYTSHPWETKVGRFMERDLPFTEVNRYFNVGRFGEKWDGKEWSANLERKQEPDMDYFGQAPLSTTFEFGKYE